MSDMTVNNQTGRTMARFSLTKYGKFPSLLMREYYENKTAFVTVPLVVAGLMVAALLVALIGGNVHEVIFDVNGDSRNGIEFMMSRWESGDMKALSMVLGMAAVAIAAPLLVILPFVVVFPLLNSLYEERVERSYLFWKSMPVADWMEVAAKLVFIGIIGPFLIFGIAMLLNVTMLIIETPFLLANDIPLVGALWKFTPFISAWVGFAFNYLVLFFWVLPILAWFMLASSYAPKAPLLYAVVPPAAIMILEGVATQGKSWLGQVIVGHLETFGRVMAPIYESSRMVMEGRSGDKISTSMPNIGDAMQGFGASLAEPGFWMGLAIAAAFLTAAMYLRRYRI